MFNKILADHDDVYSHGTILYTDENPDTVANFWVYSDMYGSNTVEGEVLKDIYLKGCVVAVVAPDEDDRLKIVGYRKPTALDITPDGEYKLSCGSGSSSGGGKLYVHTIRVRYFDGDGLDFDSYFVVHSRDSEPISDYAALSKYKDAFDTTSRSTYSDYGTEWAVTRADYGASGIEIMGWNMVTKERQYTTLSVLSYYEVTDTVMEV